MSELKLKRKKNDIQKLLEMLKTINKLKINVSDTDVNVMNTLIEIGELSGGISFNNKDSECIRNKYGYVQRTNESQIQINDSGIHFKKLYQLKQTLSTLSDHEKQTILLKNEVKDRLVQGLYNLQKIIANILCKENELPSDVELEKQIQTLKSNYDPKVHNILELIEFSKERYEQMSLRKIKDELISLEIVDFSSRDDMYYFARIFTIIGELLHEMMEDQTNQMKSELLSAFKNLNNTRDLLIHNHKKIELYAENKKNMEEVILKLKQDLLTIIKTNKEDMLLINVDDLETAQSLKLNSKKLNDIIKSKPSQIDKPSTSNSSTTVTSSTKNNSTTNIIKLFNNLKNLITLAAKSFNNKNSDELLNKHNLNYQEIKGKIMNDLVNNQHESFQKLIEELETFPKILSKDNKQTIIDLSNKITVERQQDQLEKKKKIDEENKNREQMKTRAKINEILEKIFYEMNYLRAKEHLTTTNKKDEYVMDHIVSLIGQYIRDLYDFFDKLNKLGDNLIFPIPTNISHEASYSAKTARSCELVHDIFSLNRESLRKRITDDILPAHKHFYAISSVYDLEYCQNKNATNSVHMYLELGLCYMRLHMWKEGMECFKNAIDRMEEINTKEYYLSKLKFTIDDREENVADMHKITFYKCIANSCSDVSHLYLLFIKWYTFCCVSIFEEYDKAYELLKPIYANIELVKDSMDFNPEYYSCVSEICTSFAICLYHRQDNYQKVLKLAETYTQLSMDLESNVILIKTYIELNKYKEANKLIQLIFPLIKNLNNTKMMFHILELKYVSFQHNNSEDPFELINEIETLLSQVDFVKREKNDFKIKMGDDFVAIHLFTIYLELQLLYTKLKLVYDKQMNFSQDMKSKLIQIEESFNNIINNLDVITVVIDQKLPLIYKKFTRVCCRIVIFFNHENDFEKMLIKANDYFDKINKSDKSECAFDLSIVNNHYPRKYLPKTEFEKRIKYFKKALDILQPYNQDKNDISVNNLIIGFLIDLGCEHFNLANKKNSRHQSIYAFENYCKSMQYLEEIKDDFNLEFSKKYQIYSTLTQCYEKIGIMGKNIDFFQKAIAYYDKITELLTTQIQIVKNTSPKTNSKAETEELEGLVQMAEYLKQECLETQFKIIQECVVLWFELRRVCFNLYQVLRYFLDTCL